MSNAHRTLAVVAAVLGGLAALAGSPRGTGGTNLDGACADVAGLAAEIAGERDHVAPLELAEWIRDGRPGLRVVDVRSTEKFDGEHVPTAEPIGLEALMTTTFGATETIVLYSEEGIHAGQAWVLLRALGYRQVFFLRGGLSAWVDEVLHPTLAEGSSADEQAPFARAAALSRYFGGVPRAGGGKPSLPPRRRQGC